MPKYRVLEKSFINDGLVEEGTIVDFDGVPGPNLEAIDAEAEAAVQEAPAPGVNANDIARQKMAAIGGNPDAIEAAKAANAASTAAEVALSGGDGATALL